MQLKLLTPLITALVISPLALAQKAKSPAESLKDFKLPEGFIIELVASEENGLINPIDLTFDDAGQLWTQTARMYPLDPISDISFGKAMQLMQDPQLPKKYPKVTELIKGYKLENKGTDQILIIEDPTKTSEGPLRVWADGLTIPQSIMPYKNGAFVAHGSEMFFLSDEDKDGKQDKMSPKFTGFGVFDTHTMAHSIVRGPGNWMHFSHGAVNSGNVKVVETGEEVNVTFSKNLRFKNDGSALEIINCHRDNNWGYQVRENGQWYATSANDNGYSVLPYESMMSIKGLGDKKMREYSPFFPPIHKFRVGGTGISGLAFSENGAQGFPEEWKDVAFLANPMTRTLNAVRIKRNADGSVEAKHLKDFLTCEDEWFRPVNIEFGPDGCLYIADWYNKIISHNEVRRDHPDRDRKNGRVYRIRHESQTPRPIPNLITAKTPDLIQHLSADIQWEKRAAWHQIVDRGAKELAPQLKTLIQDPSQTDSTRITALWSLEGLGEFDQAFLAEVMASGGDDLKREAIRALGTYQPSAEITEALLTPYLEDANASVRSQVLRTLEEVGVANSKTIGLLVKACKPSLPGNALGGNYERNFERFLARKALESYRPELEAFLTSPESEKVNPENLLWALQALSDKQREEAFIKIWKQASGSEIDDNTFIGISTMLGNPKVKKLVAPTFKSKPKEMLELALTNYRSLNGPAVAQFYQPQIEQMLKSSDDSQVSEALDIINKLSSPYHTKTLVSLINSKKDSSYYSRIFFALGNDPKLDRKVYQNIFTDSTLNFHKRLQALSAWVIKNPKAATGQGVKWITSLSDPEKAQAVQKLAYSPQGASIIQSLYSKKALTGISIDYKTAFILSQSKRGKIFKQILTTAQQDRAKAKKALDEKIAHYTENVPKLTGNAETGKAIFGSCLICHAVNGEGQNLAPPLDGGKDRDIAHLITAIMSPDEAIEAVYGLSYAIRTDGFAVEGYLKKSDDAGVSIAQPGGAITFIPRNQLLRQGGVDGKSFMPSHFAAFPEQTIADLVTHIKSLK